MSIRYLDFSGAVNFWTNIKNFVLSKIPTKTSELTNDSGFLTQHQSLSNYVTLNSSQTIAGIKTITGGNQGKMIFKNPNFTVGTAPEATTTVTRIYFGGGASYDSSTGVITNDITSGGYSQLEIGALNNNSSNSYRTSLLLRYEQDQTRPRFIKSWGDFCPYSDNTYYLGRSDLAWKECYCNAYYLGTTAFGDIVTHNASEFLTSHQSLSNYSTLANTVKSLSISGKTITVTPGSGSAYTLTTQDTVYTHPTTSGNKHIPSGGSSGQFLGWDSDGTAKWVNNPNTNTDTLMTQNVSTTNDTYPVLLVATANATANQGAKTGIFAKSVKVNPSTNVISASGFSGPLIGNVTGNCSGSSGSCTGNASSATEFSANKSVTLTGDVTGTASSKAGWSVATTLANSGVTAGTYGPSADVTGSNNATISVPEITVDAKGRVTAVTNRTYKSVNTDSDKKVYQYYKSDDNVYRLLFSNNSGNTATSNVGAVYSGLNNSFYVNPSTGSLYATKLYSGGTEVKVADYDTHITDTDIHVTTADKNRWNNQTYVFRYSSTALTASSTNSNALLDNTDNLKVGDKVIDSSGVLFSITAIDTANSTFAVGTPLTQLVVDANVMHLSGNETADGLKTFLKYITSDGSSTGDEYSSNTRTNLWLMSNRDTEKVSGVLFDTYRQNAVQGKGIHVLGIGIKENSVRYEGCRFGWYWYNDLNGYSFDFKPTTAGANQALNHNLGTSYDKWDTINGINPGSLSLPDLDNGIDISGYITVVTNVVKESLYTPTVDGWISVSLTRKSGGVAVLLKQGNVTSSGYRIDHEHGTATCDAMLPVVGGVQVSITSSRADDVVSAKFYPCQGNI